MRTFTKRQLVSAWYQIEQARNNERALAMKAALWLNERCDLSLSVTEAAVPVARPDAPYLPTYWLSISYSQYSNFNEWLRARLVKPPELPGISREESGFWLELGKAEGFPAGTRFYCHTAYYDAHAGGF